MQQLPTSIEDALQAWASAIHPDAPAIWSTQDGHRPRAPFIELSVIAGPQAIGPAEERYAAPDTYTYAVRRRCTLSMQFYGDDALVRAAAVQGALELPSRQAYLQAAGIAVWGAEGPRDITALVDTRHEGRALLDIFLSYPDPVDDAPGEIRRVRLVGTLGSLTVDRTADIEA